MLALLTALDPDWIEEVFKVDPDAGNGSLEWLIVAGFGVLVLSAAALGRRHDRAARTRLNLHRNRGGGRSLSRSEGSALS